MWDTEVARIGKRLHAEGLVGGNFGNVSIREAGGLYIKRKNGYLDEEEPLIHVPLEGLAPDTASRESVVHQEIYRTTSYRAVVHAHPPHAIALSYVFDEITPQDCEGVFLCPRIRVVDGASGTPALARTVAFALQTAPAVIVRGHGTFAAGSTLDEAYVVTSAVEHACRILILTRHMTGT